MGTLHVQKIQHTDFIALGFQKSAGVPQQLAFGIQNHQTGVGLTDISLGIFEALACAAAADNDGQQIS